MNKPNELRLQDNQEYALLIKIGSEEALNNMRKGHFWLQSPRYFQTHFENEARDDVYESAFDYVEMDPNAPDKVVKAHYFEEQNQYRILCFGLLSVKNGIVQIPDDRMRLFGSHFSYVNRHRLFDAFSKKTSKLGAKCYMNGVNYITKHYKGVYTPFCKFPKFEYQNEWRIVVCNKQYLSWDDCQRDEFDIAIDNIDEWFTKPIPIEELFLKHTLDELIEIFLD